MRLRDYQTECLKKIDKEKARGIQKMLAVLPTGTGKTIIFAQRIKDTSGKALILVHRDELLRQARDKLLTVWPKATIGIVKASQNELDAQVTIASVQTLSRKNRLEQVAEVNYELIVTDEAHHSVAPSYRRIYDIIWNESPEQIHLGVTATADRSDRKNLGKVFQKIIYRRNLLEMIKLGWLCDLRCLLVQTNISLGGVRVRRGDFVTKELSSVVNTRNRNSLIVKAYQEHAAGRKSLCFTVDVQHAHDLAEVFQGEGIEAVALSGETPMEERHSILDRFHNDEVEIICNCMVLTEGFDEPGIEGILLARPTKSSLLYQQMIGRGTRTFPGKKDCLILDVADNSGRHSNSIMSIPRIFNVPEKEVDESRTITETVDYVASQIRSDTPFEGDGVVAREVNLFATSGMAWVKVNPRKFILNLGDIGTIRVMASSKRPGKYVSMLLSKGLSQPEWLTTRPVDLSWAMGLSESTAVDLTQGETILLDKNARWRLRPVSDKQKRILSKHSIDLSKVENRGQANDMISALFAGGNLEEFRKAVVNLNRLEEDKQMTLWSILDGEK